MTTNELTVKPLTPGTWDDFETVMGTNGGARGCWCLHWRLSMEEFMASRGDGNKAAMRRLARRKTPPGVVAYLGDEPVAWCGFGSRSDFPRMERSTVVKPVDDEPVVSLTCLFVRKDRRGEGLLAKLIAAVCDYLGETAKARTVEAYPVEPAKGRKAGADNAMTGIASAFVAAGFTEVARRKKDRPIMRLSLR